MLVKLMHLEYQASEGIILINGDHVIWFLFVKTQRFSSCSYLELFDSGIASEKWLGTCLTGLTDCSGPDVYMGYDSYILQ